MVLANATRFFLAFGQRFAGSGNAVFSQDLFAPSFRQCAPLVGSSRAILRRSNSIVDLRDGARLLAKTDRNR